MHVSNQLEIFTPKIKKQDSDNQNGCKKKKNVETYTESYWWEKLVDEQAHV